MGDLRDNTFDARKWDVPPWYGEQGAPFTRIFRPDFEGILHGKSDDFATFYDHLITRDDPGAPIAAAAGGGNVAHPGAAIGGQAGGAMIARSTLAYELRKKATFNLIRKHIPVDSIRAQMDALLVPGAVVTAFGIGCDAWDIAIANGIDPQTALFDDTSQMVQGPADPLRRCWSCCVKRDEGAPRVSVPAALLHAFCVRCTCALHTCHAHFSHLLVCALSAGHELALFYVLGIIDARGRLQERPIWRRGVRRVGRHADRRLRQCGERAGKVLHDHRARMLHGSLCMLSACALPLTPPPRADAARRRRHAL